MRTYARVRASNETGCNVKFARENGMCLTYLAPFYVRCEFWQYKKKTQQNVHFIHIFDNWFLHGNNIPAHAHSITINYYSFVSSLPFAENWTENSMRIRITAAHRAIGETSNARWCRIKCCESLLESTKWRHSCVITTFRCGDLRRSGKPKYVIICVTQFCGMTFAKLSIYR